MSASAAILTTVAQTGMTFASQQREAKARQQQGMFEQQAYNRNAAMSDLQAADALARGGQAAGIKGREVRAAIGDARVSLAGQGVALDTGSALDVQSNIAQIGALDIATIRNNAAREAWGFTTQASDQRMSGVMAKYGADAAARGMRTESYNTLITGATKTYGLYREKKDSTTVKTVTPTPKAQAPQLMRRGVDVVPMTLGRGSV